MLRRLASATKVRIPRELAVSALLVSALLLVGCVLLGNAQRPPAPAAPAFAANRAGDSHIVLIALDGVRLREVFEGSDLTLVRAQRVPLSEHRSAREILPNLYALMERHGTSLGAPSAGSRMSASGPNFVSLPGYTEMLTGRRVSACRDNDCQRGGARTVLDDCASLADSVILDCAAITSWPSIGRIVAEEPARVALSFGRSGGTRRTSFTEDLALREALSQGERASNFPGHGDFRPDRYTARVALRYLEVHEPRFLFIGLGEPDEYAHRNNYAAYLRSLRAADELIGQVARKLDALQARGARTALFVTTDHGRADSFVSHGAAHAESAKVWLVAAGSEIHARGTQMAHPARYLADIAPTIRRLMRVPDDLHPQAGQALHELFTQSDVPAVDLTPSAPNAGLEARSSVSGAARPDAQ